MSSTDRRTDGQGESNFVGRGYKNHHWFSVNVSDTFKWGCVLKYIGDLAQDCSNSSALAMGLLQSCALPSYYPEHEKVTTTECTVSVITYPCLRFDTHLLIHVHGPLTRYVKLQVAHAPGMPGTFPPAADFKGNRYLAIPACITARAWRTCRDACRDR